MSDTKKDDRLKAVPLNDDATPRVYGVIAKKGRAVVSRRAFLGSIGAGILSLPVSGCSKGRTVESASCAALRTHHHGVNDMCISQDGHLLASAGEDMSIKLWSLPQGELQKTINLDTDSVSLDISPDGKLLAAATWDKTVRLFSIPEGEVIKTIQGHTNMVASVCISPDGTLLATASWDETVKLWSFPEGALLKTLKGHTADVTSVCFSPDGKLLASASEDETINLWSVPDGARLKTLKGPTPRVGSICISPDGKTLAAGSGGNGAWLWSLPDGAPIELSKRQQSDTGLSDSMHITSVCISIDNKVLATASKDGTVKLWSLPDASLLTIFKGHADWVTAVSISPDLMLLASGSKDNTIRLWYFPEGEPNRCIFDYAISDYTHVKKYREMGAKTHTLPCGKPVPSGAVCECDCVAGMVRYKGIETVCTCDAISVDRATVLPEEVGCYCDTVNVGVWNSGHGTSDCYSHKICSCDSVCSCVGHTSRSRGGHYWRPN